jgi:IS605 OrfB family transposase
VSDSLRTYQTRISPVFDEVLSAYAHLMAQVEHHIYSDIQSGKSASELKSSYLIQFHITARQFNSLRVRVEGRMDSVRKQILRRLEEKKGQIEAIEETLQRLKNKTVIHQKKRRLTQLVAQKVRLEAELKKGAIPLCFGGRKLFLKQFALEENGYSTHSEWKAEWQQARASEIFLLGSKDETSGNQSCTASLNEEGSLTLRLRLPDALVPQFGKYLIIPNIRFAYGGAHLAASLRSCILRQELSRAKDPSCRLYGKAITWRFKKDAKGWRIFASTDIELPKPITSRPRGVVAVDINSDHLAVVELDRFGNPVHRLTLPLSLHQLTTHQARARIGDTAAALIAYCASKQKPLVIEDLDFQKKKSQLRELSALHARMLSAFAYKSILAHLKARGETVGVEVQSVNPAYTSLIGRVKFADRYGLSIHHAAALSIGRRYLGVSERMPQGRREIPDGKGGHVTLDLPVRNRTRHVWTQWGQLKRKLQAALPAHFQAAKRRSSGSRKATL